MKMSEGNSKIGKVQNISLPPGSSCRDEHGNIPPCYNNGCYARKAFRMYPSVRTAWSNNINHYLADPVDYFRQIRDAVKPGLFRWHVAGDIVDQDYLEGMISVAIYNQDTRFLCFTKKYWLGYSGVPENLQIVFSAWPGYPLPDQDKFPIAWLESDIRRPLDGYYLRCPGQCTECGHKCWTALDAGIDVVFKKH